MPLTGCVISPCSSAEIAPFLHHQDWGQGSTIAKGHFKLEQVATDEFTSWSSITPLPVYVTLPGFGAGVTRRSRVVRGTKHYIVRKLDPLEGKKPSKYSGKYWDVPETITDPVSKVTAQAVFPMKYVVAHFFLDEKIVDIYASDGTDFKLKLSELAQIKDHSILIAKNALINDYPDLLENILGFRPTPAPMFTRFDDKAAPEPVQATETFDQFETKRALSAPAALGEENGGDVVDLDDITDETQSSSKIEGNMSGCNDKRGCYCHVINLKKLGEAIARRDRVRYDTDKDDDPHFTYVARRVNEIGELVSGTSEYDEDVLLHPGGSIGSHLAGYQDMWAGTSAEAHFPYGNQYLSHKELF